MASFTIQPYPEFTVGATVSLYANTGQRPPLSAPLATATVASNGTVTFTNLAEGAHYIAGVGTGASFRGVDFTTGYDSTNPSGAFDSRTLATDLEVQDAIARHNTDTTGVHGIADTAALKALSLTATGTEVLDTAQFAAAVSALGGAGTVEFGHSDFALSSWPSFDSTTNITLKGQGGRSNGDATATRLVYSGTAPVSAKSSHGFRVCDLAVVYTNPALAGKLFDLSHATASDSTFASFERCTITGLAGVATGATSLVSLANAHDMQIRDCMFGYAVCGIRGKDIAGDYSNRVLVEGCEFGNMSQAPVQSAAQAWTFESCTFEQLANGNAGAYNQTVGGANQLTFSGCWFGDSNTSGRWIAFGGVGLVVTGSYLVGGATSIDIGVSSFGVSITGNHFEGSSASALATGVNVAASCVGIVVLANNFVNSGPTAVTSPVTLADDPPGSVFQYVSGDSTTPTLHVPGKMHVNNYVSLKEITDPGSASVDRGRLFLKDNGSGKTQLCVRFNTGATQVISTEP